MTTKDNIDLNNLYLVSGRVEGDDDDSQQIVEAPDEGAATAAFVDDLRSFLSADEVREIYVINCSPLLVEIEQRLIAGQEGVSHG